MRRLISKHVESDELDDLRIPLHEVAVDVISDEELRLSHGPLSDAVLASCAIPGVLEPVAWGDRTLMDGGVANNTPISQAVELGARRIYVLPTGHACAPEERPRGALGMALHAVSRLTHRRLVDDIERHRPDAEPIVLPPPCPSSITPIEFDRAGDLIERARGRSEGPRERGQHRDAIDMRLGSEATKSEVRIGSQASLTRR